MPIKVHLPRISDVNSKKVDSDSSSPSTAIDVDDSSGFFCESQHFFSSSPPFVRLDMEHSFGVYFSRIHFSNFNWIRAEDAKTTPRGNSQADDLTLHFLTSCASREISALKANWLRGRLCLPQSDGLSFHIIVRCCKSCRFCIWNHFFFGKVHLMANCSKHQEKRAREKKAQDKRLLFRFEHCLLTMHQYL